MHGFLSLEVTADEERDIWGTADFIFIWKSKKGNRYAMIVDFKYGEGVQVVAQENWQLIGYAYGTLREYIDTTQFKAIEGHIYQPRTDHETRARSI